MASAFNQPCFTDEIAMWNFVIWASVDCWTHDGSVLVHMGYHAGLHCWVWGKWADVCW